MSSPRATQQGLSLIELIVSLTIMAVLAVMAAPSYNSLMDGWKVTAVSKDIIAGLQLARGEAIRRNTKVSFSVDTTTNHWIVTESTTGVTITAICVSPPSGYVRQSCEPNPQLTNTANFTYVVFNSQGWRDSTDSTADPTMTLSAPSTSTTQVKITIGVGGQIRSCDPTITSATDIRAC